MTSSKAAAFMVFSLVLLCVQSSKFVLGDDDLIHQRCEAATAPETCIKCLKFDPRSKETKDINVYVSILFDCMNNHASALQNDMSALAFTAGDASTKEVYTDCVDWFTCSKSDLFAASLGLRYGDFETAGSALYTALIYHDSCRNAALKTEAFKDGLPVEISVKLTAYKELYDAATKMLAQSDV